MVRLYYLSLRYWLFRWARWRNDPPEYRVCPRCDVGILGYRCAGYSDDGRVLTQMPACNVCSYVGGDL